MQAFTTPLDTISCLLLRGQSPEVFGDGVGITGRNGLPSAATHAAGILCAGDAAEFEFHILDAREELADDLRETCGVGGEQARVDALHLADEVLNIAVSFARDIGVTAQQLFGFGKIADPTAKNAVGVSRVGAVAPEVANAGAGTSVALLDAGRGAALTHTALGRTGGGLRSLALRRPAGLITGRLALPALIRLLALAALTRLIATLCAGVRL